MVKDGIYYGVALSAAGALLWYLLNPAFAAPLFVLALFCLYFFRDPDRAIPDGPVAVSPADGKVVGIIGDGDGAESTRISIFLNIFDVHVNRAPIAGKIANVDYTKGQFLVASREDGQFAERAQYSDDSERPANPPASASPKSPDSSRAASCSIRNRATPSPKASAWGSSSLGPGSIFS